MLVDEENKKKKPKSFKEFEPSKYVNTEPTLDEAAKGTAVISFGRMNPVTVGHEKLVNKVLQVATKAKATPLVYLSHSEDPRKNPLSYSDKISFAQKAFGRVIQKSKARTIIEVAKELNGKFANLIVVVGSDRVAEFNTLLNKYNGKEYNFQVIDVQSAGERDPDAEGVEGMSASKMRSLAADNDLNQFKKGLPKRLQRDAQKVLDAVRSGMNLSEALNELFDEEIEDLNEVLDRAQRLKRSIAMRRARHKIKRGREMASRKKASTEKLQQRARKKAIQTLKDKFAKNKRYADMDPAAKAVVDKRIEKISDQRIQRIAKKLLPDVKKKERQKFQKKATDNPLTPKAEAIKVKQDRDIDDRPGSQPAGYYKGVDKDKKDARAKHFERGAKMSDDNPAAYKPAPGDAEAKTKPSKHTKKYKQMFGEDLNEWVCGQCNAEPCVCEGDIHEMWGKRVTKRPHMLMDRNNKVKFDKRFKMYAKKDDPNDPTEVLIDGEKVNEDLVQELADLIESTEGYMAELGENAKAGLKKKAEKTGISYGILKKVYDRGVAAWRTGHRPGTTPEQWGYARVNSFVTKGKGTWGKADADLAAKVRKEEMDINDKAEQFLESYEKKRRETIKNEVLDTPKAMQSYKNKAKASKDRATNSAVAKILRKGDHSDDLRTRAKREKGLKMVDRNAKRKTFKALRGENAGEESFNVKEAFSKALKEAKTLRLLPMRVNRGGENNAKMLADEINNTFTKSNIKMRAIKVGKTWHVEGEGDNPTKLAQIVKFLGANGVGHGEVDDQPEIKGGKIPDAAHMKKIDKAIKDLRASHPYARGHDNINYTLEDMKKKLITKEMAYTQLDYFLGRIGVIKSLQPHIKKSEVFQQWLEDDPWKKKKK